MSAPAITPVGLTSGDPLPGFFIETNFAQGPAVGSGLNRAILVLANKSAAGDATPDTEIYGPDTTVQLQTEPQMILSFLVKNPTGGDEVVPVVYKGLKPDMFAAGRDVLIDGDYIGGSIQAAKLQTQCPSKYEPVVPGAAPAEGSQPAQMPGVAQMTAQ